MGSLLLQIGQCGCQIGLKIHDEIKAFKEATYLKRPKTDVIHAIMLDTEPKILKPILDNKLQNKHLDPLNIKYFQHGRGNNWSYGYIDSKRRGLAIEPKRDHLSELAHCTFSKNKPNSFTEKYFIENSSMIEFVLEAIGRQIQKTDCFLGINVLCSLGGGTGSGLGTRLIEEIKDNMNIRVITHAILPNQAGETPLQHYNCALSISSMYEYSDAIFTYQNDVVTRLFKESDGSLDTINEYISNCIMSLFRLNDYGSYPRFYFDLIQEAIVAHDLKFLELFASNLKKQKHKPAVMWQDVMANCFDQLANANISEAPIEGKEKALHVELVSQGNERLEVEKFSKKLSSLLNPVSPISIDHIDTKEDKKCLIVANRTRILRYLRYVADKGGQKLKVGAYTWNYKVDLEPAFENLDNIISLYEQI